MVVDGVKVNEAIDYRVTRKLNEVDIMTFDVVNEPINRERFKLEKGVFVDLLKEWGIIVRRQIVRNKIKLTWEQQAWHLKRRLYGNSNTPGRADVLIRNIVTHANGLDTPFKWNYEFNGNVSTSVSVDLKYNTHLEAIQAICSAGNFNVRFKKNTIIFGKTANLIDVSDNKKIVDKLESDQDLAKYGNRFTFPNVGNGEVRDRTGASNTQYVYDKVITNVKATESRFIENLRLEYENVRPIIRFQMRIDEFTRYNFNVGDILRVDLGDNDTGENGYYRIVRMEIGRSSVEMFLEFSADGEFSSRTFDPSNTIAYLGKKIKEIELYM